MVPLEQRLPGPAISGPLARRSWKCSPSIRARTARARAPTPGVDHAVARAVHAMVRAPLVRGHAERVPIHRASDGGHGRAVPSRHAEPGPRVAAEPGVMGLRDEPGDGLRDAEDKAPPRRCLTRSGGLSGSLCQAARRARRRSHRTARGQRRRCLTRSGGLSDSLCSAPWRCGCWRGGRRRGSSPPRADAAADRPLVLQGCGGGRGGVPAPRAGISTERPTDGRAAESPESRLLAESLVLAESLKF